MPIFKAWYEKNRESKTKNYYSINFETFIELDFEFQSGIFEKFLGDSGFWIDREQDEVTIHKYGYKLTGNPFKDLIIKLFNDNTVIDYF